MSAAGLAPGEWVTVTVHRAQVEAVREDADGTVVDVLYGNTGGRLSLLASAPAVWVQRVGPAHWPPRDGDVWAEPDGREWFARSVTDGVEPGDWMVELVSAVDGAPMRQLPGPINDRYGPLRLVRRRGWPIMPEEPAQPLTAAQLLSEVDTAVDTVALPPPLALGLGPVAVLEFGDGHTAAVDAWATHLGLPAPALAERVNQSAAGPWRSYSTQADTHWSGWAVRLWCPVAETLALPAALRAGPGEAPTQLLPAAAGGG